jgi:hypothetical protein
MRRSLLIMIAVLGLPAFAQAQSPEPTVSLDLGIFLAGVDPATGGQPLSAPTNFVVSQALCGQLPKSVAKIVNPTKVNYDDPADATKDCSIAAASTVLSALPFGTGYRLAMRAHGANSVSGWSPLSVPFDHAAVAPAIPANVRPN